MTDPFASLLAAAEADERVAGVVLGGGRGKGFVTDGSDWDVYVVVADGASAEDVRGGLDVTDPRLDLCAVLTLAEFADHARPGRPDEWNAYTFAHVTPALDRTGGLLRRLCDAKEHLPGDVARDRAEALLDAYVNACYRSVKNARDGDAAAALLDAAESVPPLLAFVFAAERRVRPYNKFLAWELSAHPLQHHWWPGDDPVADLLHLVRTGDTGAQAAQFRRVEEQARVLGYGGVLDAWGTAALTVVRTAG